MNKNILLISSPMTYIEEFETIRLAQPLGLCYIAVVLEKNGFNTRILDAHADGFSNRIYNNGIVQVGMDEMEITEEVKKFNPSIVGVSSMFTDQYKNAHMVCKSVKNVSKDIITVMGGVHPTVATKYVLEDTNVDYVIKGESEYTFNEFCNSILNERDVTDIDGLNFNPKSHWIEDLDELPFPARHLLNLKSYFNVGQAYREPSKREPAFPMITSRCCPASCNFCASHIMQGRYRERSVGNVIQEIELLVDKYGMKEIYFLDDALAHGNFREILKQMIINGYDLSWHGANGTAVYSLDDEIIKLFADSGCYKVLLAIESGVQKTLKYMRKPVKLSKVKHIVKLIQEYGMKAESLFMIGFPSETKEDILNTVKFAESLDLDYVTFPLATPFVGTDLYEDCLRNGNLVDGFTFDRLKFGIGNIKTKEWGPKFVENVRKESWKRINRKL